MIRQRPIEHKRKNSQLELFHPLINQHSNNKNHHLNDIDKHKKVKSSQNKKLKMPKKQQRQSTSKLDGKSILRLVQNSSKLRDQKITVIEDIDHHQFSDQNVDCVNGGGLYSRGLDGSDEQNLSFFQFGRKSRSSCHKDQKPPPSTIETQENLNRNQNYELTMEQIMEVPDTLSNSRRYDNSNGKIYHFTTMFEMQQTQKKIIDNQGQKNSKQHQKNIKNERIQAGPKQLFTIIKKQQTTKNLNKRKEKHPKQQIMNKQSIQKERFTDFSTISCNSKKKSKLLLGNKNKDEKMSKNKYNNNSEKEKQKQKLTTSSMLVNKKQKHTDSQMTKKKSLPLKNKNKSLLKLSSQKLSCINNSRSLQNKSQTSLSFKKNKSTTYQRHPAPPNTAKLSISDKIQLIQNSQSKLQSQYKMLFECVGELWETNKITRYEISEKNKSDIMKLQQEDKLEESKFGKLKSQILTAISSARY